MAVIAFGAPGIDRFHLHERLRRELVQRGHRVPVLCTDRPTYTFWRCQGDDVWPGAAGAPDPMRAPLANLAARECTRRGVPVGAPTHRREHARVHRRLAATLPALLAWFEQHRPDVLLLHGSRSAERALLQYVAEELGIRTLWTGDGLLPHTLQIDERGLDGDATPCRRPLTDYRVVRSEPSLLEACLTNMLARSTPAALTRRDVVVPPLHRRCGDALDALARFDVDGARAALAAWRSSLPAAGVDHTPPARLPQPPFVALLLQSRTDERLRLDCDAPPSERDLVASAAAAVAALDPRFGLLVIVPPDGIDHRCIDGLHPPVPLHFASAAAAPEAAATALATITVNHPAASAALLAGTPVLHTGRALYGVHGVATAATTATLTDALQRALDKDHPALRRRYLTWLFGHGHLWCSPTHPDHNGLVGLVQAIETRLQDGQPRMPKSGYRAGPAWPLAADGRGH